MKIFFARICSFLLLTALTASFLQAQKNGASQNPGVEKSQSSSLPYRKIENKAFIVGEELTFDVNYGFITAGEAKMMIPRYSTMKGRQCYHIEFTVNSKPFFDAFYKVRDKYESHLDVEGLYPWKFVQRIREGGYKKDYSALFDNERLIAITPNGEYPIEPFTQDVLSAFYFMRTFNYEGLRAGQKVYLKNFHKDSTHTLTVIYLGKETIKVEAGKFNTIMLEPVMKEGGLFKSSGRIVVWLTDDERRIPIQVEAEIPIGSITSELISYKGINGPIRSKVK